MLKLGKGKKNYKHVLTGETLLEIKAPDLQHLHLEGDFSKLTMLGLYTPSLNRLPTGLTLAVNLKILKLKVGIDFEFCSQDPVQNLSLKNLTLCGTQLDQIPSALFAGKISLSLEDLFLNENKLSDLPQSLMDCKKLKRLNLASNQLTKIPVAVTRLESLISIDLDNNPLSENERQLAYKLWGIW